MPQSGALATVDTCLKNTGNGTHPYTHHSPWQDAARFVDGGSGQCPIQNLDEQRIERQQRHTHHDGDGEYSGLDDFRCTYRVVLAAIAGDELDDAASQPEITQSGERRAGQQHRPQAKLLGTEVLEQIAVKQKKDHAGDEHLQHGQCGVARKTA